MRHLQANEAFVDELYSGIKQSGKQQDSHPPAVFLPNDDDADGEQEDDNSCRNEDHQCPHELHGVSGLWSDR